MRKYLKQIKDQDSFVVLSLLYSHFRSLTFQMSFLYPASKFYFIANGHGFSKVLLSHLQLSPLWTPFPRTNHSSLSLLLRTPFPRINCSIQSWPTQTTAPSDQHELSHAQVHLHTDYNQTHLSLITASSI